MPDHLTPAQRSVLLVLMAEAREVPNVDLTSTWRLKLSPKSRSDLEKKQLITVRKERNRLHLDLTGEGSQWCREQLDSQVPANMGHGGAAAYALLAAIRRHLARTGGSLTAFVARDAGSPVPGPDPAPPVTTTLAGTGQDDVDDVQALIRKSYQELAPRPGEWVRLSALRPRLAGLDRADVDNALLGLNQHRDVSIEPVSDQKTLTDQDWEAAVQIGNESKHVIAIGQS